MAGSSITGLVSGIDTIVVTPPAAAASLALRRVSRCSAPGSPDEGAHVDEARGQNLAGAVDHLRLGAASQRPPISWISHRATSTRARALPPAGRVDRGGRSLRRTGAHGVLTGSAVRRQRFQHGHAHGHAHLDLLADQRLRAVGDLGGDLDAPVHRAGMHHQGVGLGIGELLLVEAVEAEILLDGGDEGAVHALALEAQHHDDVGVLQALAHVGEDLDAEPLDAGGQQGRRGDEAHPRAQARRAG